ncbi:hypothetical protein [Deinococcus sp.]|uniref:hypothetical protein n=1 Tax=Deinococcus sp. TaxID=47478 RepID=UPI003C7C1AF2
MPRTTDVAIIALPVVACLALFGGLQLFNPQAESRAPALALSANTATLQPPPRSLPTIAARPDAPAADLAQTATPDRTQPPVPPTSVSPTLVRGRELAGLLYGQHLGEVWDAFSPSVRREWGSYAAFQKYREGGLSAYGAEAKVLAEAVRQSGDVRYYTRTAQFERGAARTWTLILGLNQAAQVVEFNIVGAGVLPGTGTQDEQGSAP